jgi:NhaA family Na+:H+ antiporter
MTKVFKEMVEHDAAGGVLLVIAAFVAMIFANSALSDFYNGTLDIPIQVSFGDFIINKPLLLWVNDGLMAIFFLVVGLEVKREIIEGHLSSADQIILPAIGAVAGIAIPALIYAAVNNGDELTMRGWAIPSATDIAFALGLFTLFGKHLPLSLKLFLLSVAIFDDIGAIIIIAIFYSTDLSQLSLVIASAGLVLLFIMNRLRIKKVGPYMLVGVIVWAAVLKSGVHATLAGFAIAWFIPINVKNDDGNSLLRELEHDLHPWVAFFILPVFAFANAGVSLAGVGIEALTHPITLGIVLGLFVGKQVGIFGACWLAIKLGLAKLPKGANFVQLYGVSILCGIGFTMSLFIGSLAFENMDKAYNDAVKLGVLLGSLLSVIAASIVLIKFGKNNAEQGIAPNQANASS